MTNHNYTRALSDMANGLRSKLMNSSEEFRLLASLEKLIAELSAHAGELEPEPPKRQASATEQPAAKLSNKSLRTSAYEILRESKTPLPIGEILHRLNLRGVTFAARNPRAALSSNMSQDARFENGVVGGRPMWRLKEAAVDPVARPQEPPQRAAQR